PINRFRPNIVFEGGRPYEEDEFASFEIKDITFYGVKLCSRCVLTTVDQETSEKGKEPLRTLASYRHLNNQIYFGQNLLHRGEGNIAVGDILSIKSRQAGLHER
ncbi:MAG: MOSC domain-containing protein, partial [Chitinophagaceae bacterium]|nr:MOSC domain-containing protein [Chitinophagaceae bacterium]